MTKEILLVLKNVSIFFKQHTGSLLQFPIPLPNVSVTGLWVNILETEKAGQVFVIYGYFIVIFVPKYADFKLKHYFL